MRKARSSLSYNVPGYSGTPLLKKLGYDKAAEKGGRALFVGADAGPKALRAFKGFAELKTAPNAKRPPAGPFAVIHYFETDADALAAALPLLRARLAKDGMIWVSWPKKASKVPTTITEDTIRKHALGPATAKGGGLVDVKVCAVDEVWSGLKLVIPIAQR